VPGNVEGPPNHGESVVAKTMGRRKDTYRSNEGDLRSRHFLNAPGFDKEAKAGSSVALVEQLGGKDKANKPRHFPTADT
jgi:hypothetical protein